MAKLKPNQFYLGGRLITERPILFQKEMVKAILGNRKTQTRRGKGLDLINECAVCWKYNGTTIKNNPDIHVFGRLNRENKLCYWEKVKSPYGKPGDLLWVRESFYEPVSKEIEGKCVYKADLVDKGWHFKWKPSIHMPKSAARLWLMVEDIRVEPLLDISEDDAIAEGCSPYGPFGEFRGSPHPNGGSMKYRAYSKASRAFQCIWEKINGKQSWDANPWVWVVQYRVLSKTGRPDNQTILTNHLQITGKEVTHV